MSAERALDRGKAYAASAATFAHEINDAVRAECHTFALALFEGLEVKSARLNVLSGDQVCRWR